MFILTFRDIVISLICHLFTQFQLVRDEQEKDQTKTSSAFINSLVDFIITSKGKVEIILKERERLRSYHPAKILKI